MSAADKEAVKRAVARFVADPANTRVSPGDLAALVDAEIGILFGATTIARYLAGEGWIRTDGPKGGAVYTRPPESKKARAPVAAGALAPNLDASLLPGDAGEQAADRSTILAAPIPLGTGDTNMVVLIPLNKLLLSPANCRKTYSEDAIRPLADSIFEKKRLLQNLVVSESPTGRGFFDVDAGGRRWRAMQLNVKLKRMPRDWPVPCEVVPGEEAREASLAENIHKEALNPADEVEAYAAIVADYEARGMVDPAERIAACARRQGQTVRHVQQRLRLADLAPAILEALRLGGITLDAAKAYASAPDQKAQLKIFTAEEKKGTWGHGVQAIRNALAGRTYAQTNPKVRYIGIEAYLDAGGRIEPDLFFGKEGEDLLIDLDIVDRLFTEKASAEAGQLAQADGFADGMVKTSAYSYELPRPPEGFQARYYGAASLIKGARDRAIGLYSLDGEGQLKLADQYFEQVEPAPNEAPADHQPRAGYAAAQRKKDISELAARLAAPPVAGTALEGRAFWPAETDDWMSSYAVDKEDEDFVIVALLVRVPKAEAEAKLAEAEALYERRQQEEEVTGAVEEIAQDVAAIIADVAEADVVDLEIAGSVS